MPWTRPERGPRHPIEGEERLSGQYRGLGRAGGELHFRPGQPPLLQDESSYSSYRILADTIDTDRKELTPKRRVYTGDRTPVLGTCTMKRLKEYLAGPVGFPLDAVEVA